MLAGCSIFLLSHCAAKDEVRDLSYQIRTVNKKVDEMRGTTVDQMQKRQASSFSRIDEVNDELLRMRSSFEENAFQESQFREQTKENISGLQARISSLQDEDGRRIKELEGKIQQLSREIENQRHARIRDAEKRVKAAARQAADARRRTVQAAGGSRSGIVKLEPEKRKAKVENGRSSSRQKQAGKSLVMVSSGSNSGKTPVKPKDIFNTGLAQFKAKKYKEAYAVFEQILAGNPKGDRAAETLFFMGECLFNQGEYDLAILDYQKVISNHSKHRKKPAALLRQGMSFEKLTDLETAKIIYNKLVKENPASPEAKTANDRLKRL